MNRLLMVSLLAAMAFVSAPAYAHHPVSESGALWVEPVSSLELETQFLSFEFQEVSGSALVTAFYGQVALHDRISVNLRLPAAYVAFDDGRAAMGNGDLEAGARVLLVDTLHGELLVSSGLNVEAPTGSVEDALGGGHWALVPYLIASSQLTEFFVLSAVVNVAWALDGDDDAPLFHGSPVAIHASREVGARVTGTTFLGAEFFVSGGVEVSVPLGFEELGPADVSAELGWNPVPLWRVAIGASYTVTGAAHTPHRVFSGLARQW